ncbi:MAG: double zinc ribbon domain-containing protein [Clostridia bacterium]|nr:double zinc ribbon domain-containing protein [Clostridia bacterium]
MSFKNIFNDIIGFFYPSVCMSCAKLTDDGSNLCAECRGNIVRIDQNKRCTRCGLQKPDCDCKHSIFYFDSIVSPFFNEKTARNIIYRYKLFGKSFLSDYITDNMINEINNEYKDVKFDAVIPVPTSLRSSNRKGFDHTYLLAKQISEKTGIPVSKKAVSIRPLKSSQHKSTYKQRLKNVQNKYYCKRKLDYENVLLIDDIKTTGATLNACSKELLFAGVRRVYCATALVSAKKTKSQNSP